MADASPGGVPADRRDALIREQAERLGEQERRLAAQAEQIAALEAMVADLRDRLAAAERAGSRNSGNSSMPPSADDLPGRKPPARQRRPADRAEKKKKKRGKQPGSSACATGRCSFQRQATRDLSQGLQAATGADRFILTDMAAR